jgi:hypothetical protein
MSQDELDELSLFLVVGDESEHGQGSGFSKASALA